MGYNRQGRVDSVSAKYPCTKSGFMPYPVWAQKWDCGSCG